MTMWPQPPKPCVVVDRRPGLRRRSRKHGCKGVWGHHFRKASQDCLRLLCYNTGGIGFLSEERSKESLKMHKLKKLVLNNQIDLLSLTELNKDWRKVPYTESIWSALSGWRENKRVQVSTNTFHPALESNLVGGTATCCFSDTVFRISEQGADSRKLGRWSYVVFTGKNNIKTILITCYCPVKGTSPGSAYSQQLTYMARNKDKFPPNITCPRQLFGHDLSEFISSKQDQYQIIVAGDFNSSYDELTDYMLQLGLQDMISKQHGRGPVTYQRSADSPIDRIFGSVSLKARHSGFLSFGRLSGDHRGIWVEIPKFLIYGYNPPAPVHVNARRLKLSDPRVVEKYLTFLHYECDKHNIYQRMNRVHQFKSFPLPQCVIDEYEAIDVLLSKIMQQAEKQCRKLHTNATPWSPAYKRACILLDYWLQRRIYHKGMHHNVRQLLVLQNKLKLKFNNNLSLDDINSNIVEAACERRKAKKGAEALSLEYRTQLAIAKEEAGEMKAAQYLRQLNNVENTRKLFQQIRHIEGKIFSGFTSRVTVVNDDGTTTDYTDREAMEKIILMSNEKKYHQTEGCGSQLLDDEFVELFGNYGDGPRVIDVLLGDIELPANTTDATKEFLQACQQDPTFIHPSTPNIFERYEKYKKSWKCRREATLTYNEHMGHYKASMLHEDLSWLFFQKADFISSTGYSPIKHRRCIDLMILKRQQSFAISKQRTLGILDTEYNHINGILGRDSMFAALDNNEVADEQFCRPGRCAIDQTILKRCTFDHLQYRRQCFALTSCDLAGCYDRIIHTAAALSLRRIGIPSSRITTMFHTIQNMMHKVRTAFGDSTETYGGSDIGIFTSFPQGVLQGNACGPTIWTILSSVIFKCLHKRGFSSTFCTGLSLQLFNLVGFCYVDDCDLIQIGDDPHEVILSMQQLIRSWRELMQVTGAAIATDKSWWYLVDFEWKQGKWVTVDPLLDFILSAQNDKGDTVSLKRLLSTDATEMLGVWMAPNGNKKKIIRTLRDSSLDSAGKLTIGNANSIQAWTAFQSNIFARLKYPAAACTFSLQECKAIMWPALKVCLSRSGLCSSISTSIRQGPLLSGGGGFPSYFDYQGTQRTSFLIQNYFSNTPTFKSILLNIEDIVLEGGFYGLIWSWDISLMKWLSPHSWLFHVLQYNFDNNISISIPHTTLKPNRENDKSIMSLATSNFSDATSLKAINRIRMFHNVISVSDLCQANGFTLDRRFLFSRQHPDQTNGFKGPLKHHTSSSDFTTWRRFLGLLFPSGHLPPALKLSQWRLSPMDDNCYWPWFLSNDRQFLFHKVSNTLWHRHLKRGYSHYLYNSEFLVVNCPRQENLMRCSAQSTDIYIKVLSVSNHNIMGNTSTTIRWAGIIPLGPKSTYPFLRNITHSENTSALQDHILNGTAVAVSDGSYYESHSIGAFGWIVTTPDHEEWIKGGSLTPGPSVLQSAFRSELCGQAAIASFFHSYCYYCGVPRNSPSSSLPVRVGIDCKPTIPRVTTPAHLIKASFKHFDIISAIVDLWQSSRFTPSLEYIIAHQDDYDDPLTPMETLNVEMDNVAKGFALQAINTNAKAPSFSSPHGYHPINCHGEMICSNLQKSMYEIILHHQCPFPVFRYLSERTLKQLCTFDPLYSPRLDYILQQTYVVSLLVYTFGLYLNVERFERLSHPHPVRTCLSIPSIQI